MNYAFRLCVVFFTIVKQIMNKRNPRLFGMLEFLYLNWGKITTGRAAASDWVTLTIESGR